MAAFLILREEDLGWYFVGGGSVTSINDAKHWRDRAAEMRTLAKEMKDSKSMSIMFKLALDYDKLANRAEERARMDVSAPSPVRK